MDENDTFLPEPNAPLPPLAQEQLLIEHLSAISGANVLCISPGRGQFARAAAEQLPSTRITCWFLDLYRARLASADVVDSPLSNLQIICSPDFPMESCQTAVSPLSVHGEAELSRDLLQAAHERLDADGVCIASVDNPRDWWLKAELEKLFDRVEKLAVNQVAIAYQARKTKPLKKKKDFSCEFAFRDQDRVLRAYSRPGVFAHRRVDPGARHLLNAMDVRGGDRVLDLGCGSGVVSMGAAARAPTVLVHAVDSNARAVQCTALAAEWNELTNVTAELNITDELVTDGGFQLALANPPYYGGSRIAASFLEAAHRALEVGGRLLLVTKMVNWYLENIAQWFEDAAVEEVKGYYLIRGRKGEEA